MNGYENESENLQHQAEHIKVRRRPSVLSYLAILFAVAFLLLLVAYFQQQRVNAEASDDARQQSVSALQSIKNLMEDNETLREQLETAQNTLTEQEETVRKLEEKINTQTADQEEKLDKLEKRVAAMDWFWQINEAYALGKQTHCKALIRDIESAGLVPYLPVESATDTGRFSPAQRYQEICDAVK